MLKNTKERAIMLGNFFESLLKFLGLKKKHEPKGPRLTQPSGTMREIRDWITAPDIPSITPRVQKLFIKPESFRKPSRIRRLEARPFQKPAKKKPGIGALQFEIEQILKEAQALQKKLATVKPKLAKPKVPKPKKKMPKRKRRFAFKPLTRDEVRALRQKLKQRKPLQDFEIERLKQHLKQPVAEKAEQELRALELDKIRKSLEEPKPRQPAPEQAAFQAAPQVQQPVAAAEESLDDQISETEELLKGLEQDFLKRRISEPEYRQRVLDLDQKLRELKIRKKKQEQLGLKPKPMPVVPQAAKVQAQEQAQPQVSAEMQRFLEKRFGKSDRQKLESLEEKVQELMKRFHLSEREAEAEISKLDNSKVLGNFDKLIDLIELEQKTQRLMQEHLELEKQKKLQAEEKPEFGTGFEPGMPKGKKEEVKAIVAELEKHRIVTDFDQLLELVQRRGRVSEKEASAELQIPRERIRQCIDILEDSGLVRVEIPPIGPVRIFDLNYIPPKKQKKERAKK